jgi:leucyl-tRNA synthetase
LAITKYADKLIEGLKEVDFSKEIATQQINWIGRSEGAEISFKIKDSDEALSVFTTRPDTLFGATFLVISPESIWAQKLTTQAQLKTVTEYIKEAQKKDKSNLDKDKTGVATGSFAINPATGKEIPIYIADYVLGSYGSGAIMAVPAHDGRDWDMAKKYNLPIVEVIEGGNIEKEAYTGEGKLINSGDWTGIFVPKSIAKIYSDIEAKGWGKKTVGYHLHDWVFSRQHYWGEPIPIIHCPKDGAVPVPESELPVELPYLEKYQPSGTGESPLANVTDWVKTKCPICGGEAKRETDTMPNWAGSNWYFIRYLDAHNDKEIASKNKMKYWLPIDMYQGGYEHITLHLLYSRFIYNFLFDIGVVPTSEPYAKRRSHGIVLGSDGKKMSKSFGNVVNPDDIVAKYGADTLRLYEMFMGPFDQTISWSEESLEGCYRFLGRIWRLFNAPFSDKTDQNLYIKLNHTINKVSNDIENLKFNTAVASLMEFSNDWNVNQKISEKDAARLVMVMAPLVPHIAEEIWVDILKKPYSVHSQDWPEADKEAIKSEKKTVIVQVNGKVRASFSLEAGLAGDQKEVEKMARDDEKVTKWLENEKVKKVVFVSGKLINFVI